MERTDLSPVDAEPAIADDKNSDDEEEEEAKPVVTNGQKKSTVTGLAEKSKSSLF